MTGTMERPVYISLEHLNALDRNQKYHARIGEANSPLKSFRHGLSFSDLEKLMEDYQGKLKIYIAPARRKN